MEPEKPRVTVEDLLKDPGWDPFVAPLQTPVATAWEDIPEGAPVTLDLKLGLASRPRGDDGEPL